MMVHPCFECQHYTTKNNQHHCLLKNRDTSTARIIGTERVDCWEARKQPTKESK